VSCAVVCTMAIYLHEFWWALELGKKYEKCDVFQINAVSTYIPVECCAITEGINNHLNPKKEMSMKKYHN